jgi:hypothetical protein
LTPSRDNTARLAKELWTNEARSLEPAEFQSRFDAIYLAAEGPATLWQLGGAANDYLRSHPDSIKVPEELVTALLGSKLVDGRIIGLKLLNRCSIDNNTILSAISEALESHSKQEILGGLCELSNLLRRVEHSAGVVTEVIFRKLRKHSSSSVPYIRDAAEALRAWLEGSAA